MFKKSLCSVYVLFFILLSMPLLANASENIKDANTGKDIRGQADAKKNQNKQNINDEKGEDIPIPPQPINAYLSGNRIYGDKEPEDRVDIGLLVYIKEIQEYSIIHEGDFDKHWYYIKCNIIKNNEGEWKEKDLSFVCYDKWATPESGIMEKRVLFPYLKGRVFQFRLQKNPDSQLAIITGQEERSPVPPYEKLNRPMWKWNLNEPGQKEKFDKINKAASEYFTSKHLRGGTNIIHEANDYYIVENRFLLNSEFVLIDKKTYQASSPPNPELIGHGENKDSNEGKK